MTARYAIGIDLGTTNSVLAYCDLEADDAQVELLEIPQLVAAGTVENRNSLPSFLYLAAEKEAGKGHMKLPWVDKREYAVGEMARRQSADMPDRTVNAAKSWLCHERVDRHDSILPWQAPDSVDRVSPIEASRRYILHLIEAWEHQFPNAPILQQHVVLTVPASFGPSARELTREAAIEAGLPEDVILFEEPQAAVYAWLLETHDHWREKVKVGDRLLVVDIGGGTTDLTLIEVNDEEGDLTLQRKAVGNHLLVGGDNMDLMLAHSAATRFQEKGLKLDPWQSVALWHQCRSAKESLLDDDGSETQTLSVAGRGSRLIGGAVSIEIDRASVRDSLLDGFFPLCKLDDAPQKQRASGFQEIGLPFESDTAITRHIAEFLRVQADEDQPAVQPTHILFNGGVFRAASVRRRVMDQMEKWFKKSARPVDLESSNSLDFSVARGAAFYAWSKTNGNIRIRGGAARSYYVGIETAGLAIPGTPRPLNALCVVPFGMEEGSELDVPSSEFGLVVGEPARFRFFGSTVRKDDEPGLLLTRWSSDELVEMAPLEASLPADNEETDSFVPVQFQARITELGMLELWCASTRSDSRWKLEFSVRDTE